MPISMNDNQYPVDQETLNIQLWLWRYRISFFNSKLIKKDIQF